MSPRRYDQRLRAEAADDTRRRILDAVRQLLRDAPTTPVSVDAVAKLAGVARSTVYLVFGSRPGLFEALVHDLHERGRFDLIVEAVAHPDAREHMRGAIRANVDMFASDRDVFRVLFSMAELDPDAAGGSVRSMLDGRAGGVLHAATRLAEQGMLRADLTVDDAAALLFAITSFDTYDAMHTRSGMSPADVSRLLVDLADRGLIDPTQGPAEQEHGL